MERSGVLPTTLFACFLIQCFPCDALLCVSHTLRSALESGQEARFVQIDFSATFDRVNHLDILYKLSSVFIWGSVFSILTQFLSNWSQHIMEDGCLSKQVNVSSGVPHETALGPLLFFQYTSELFSILDNKLISYADDGRCAIPGVGVTVSESLILDLGRVSEWCDLWGMKLKRNWDYQDYDSPKVTHNSSPVHVELLVELYLRNLMTLL